LRASSNLPEGCRRNENVPKLSFVTLGSAGGRHDNAPNRVLPCIVPVDGFFEWKAIKGQKAKQPYAIAMKDGSPAPLLVSQFEF